MDLIRRLLEAEPTVTIAAVASVLALLVNFGLPISESQVGSIIEAVGNVLILAGAVAGIRQAVYSPKTHSEEVKAAASGAMPTP